MLAVQVVLAPLPNIELVSVLVIVFGISLGFEVLYPLYVFVLLEGLVYGFGFWFLNYCYVWLVLALAAVLLRKRTAPLFWAVVSGGFGLMFGALCALPYLFIGGIHSAFAYWISGIPFDLVHCAGNFFTALLLVKPACNIMAKLLERY